jgi:hypothetical protein
MVKVPEAGRVKTRLARGVGTVRATQFYRHTAAAVLARLAAPGRWRMILAVTPDRTGMASRHFPAFLPRIPQGGGNLGRRMQRVMDARWRGPTLIIGTDIPGIRRSHIAEAFRLLSGSDAVLGPAPDGGYWCVGLRRTPRVLRPFEPVRWSSPETLADTLANLAGRRVARAAALPDVDTKEELALAGRWNGRRVLPASPRAGADNPGTLL